MQANKSITDIKTAELVPIRIESKPVSQSNYIKSSSGMVLSKESSAY